ncbi:DNA fragmentation factor subunit beta-like [Watersipora subatra]|uniref:DNA fragmentation factor subunit beta-like n=1 Tax=Watersipora subatra TaxID=2589382 RepID=UPI00355C0AEA
MVKLTVQEERREPYTQKIEANSLKECKKKGCQFLKIEVEDLKYITHNGDIIKNKAQFKNLNDNALLTFTTKNETDLLIAQITRQLDNVCITPTSTDRFCEQLSEIACAKPRFLQAIREKQRELGNPKESYDEDPDWFEGLKKDASDETKSRMTKSGEMRRIAEQRIKNYFYDTKDYVFEELNVPKEPKKLKEKLKRPEDLTKVQLKAVQILDEWQDKLKAIKYYSYYFSKADHAKGAFCDKKGWFECEGHYKSEIGCTYNQTKDGKRNIHLGHWINPYLSRDARTLFRDWHLDHQRQQIDVKKELVEKIKNKSIKESDKDSFYSLLFTRENIKLVYSQCHDKSAHKDLATGKGKALAKDKM